MKTTEREYKYVVWISPEEMHASSLEALSNLKFIADEYQFLVRLINTYTLQISHMGLFENFRVLLGDLAKSESKRNSLLRSLQLHENQLSIMLDDVDQIKMEKAYAETHKELQSEQDVFCTNYRELKTKIFALISKILKKNKQKRLLGI